MPMKSAVLVASLLLVAAAFGQAPVPPSQAIQDRTFSVAHADSVQQFQEVANSIRMLTEVRDMSADEAKMELKVRGTPEQIGLAEWMVQQLDRPSNDAASEAAGEYKGLTGPDGHGNTEDEVARIFYLKNLATVQDFQETANAIRTVSEVRRVFTINASKAMPVRGTPAQVAMIEWLARQLNQPANQQPNGDGGGFRGPEEDVTRVLYVKSAKTVQDFQQIANATRNTAEIRRMFTVNTPRAIVTRANPDQAAMAEWVLQQLDQPPASALSSDEYRLPGGNDDLVRVFHLAHDASVQQFQQNAAGNDRILTFPAARAVLLRGTASQLAVATQLMQQIDQ